MVSEQVHVCGLILLRIWSHLSDGGGCAGLGCCGELKEHALIRLHADATTLIDQGAVKVNDRMVPVRRVADFLNGKRFAHRVTGKQWPQIVDLTKTDWME